MVCLLGASRPEEFTFQLLPHSALVREYLIFLRYVLILCVFFSST